VAAGRFACAWFSCQAISLRWPARVLSVTKGRGTTSASASWGWNHMPWVRSRHVRLRACAGRGQGDEKPGMSADESGCGAAGSMGRGDRNWVDPAGKAGVGVEEEGWRIRSRKRDVALPGHRENGPTPRGGGDPGTLAVSWREPVFWMSDFPLSKKKLCPAPLTSVRAEQRRRPTTQEGDQPCRIKVPAPSSHNRGGPGKSPPRSHSPRWTVGPEDVG